MTVDNLWTDHRGRGEGDLSTVDIHDHSHISSTTIHTFHLENQPKSILLRDPILYPRRDPTGRDVEEGDAVRPIQAIDCRVEYLDLLDTQETIVSKMRRASKTQNPLRRFCLVRDAYWDTRFLCCYISGDSATQMIEYRTALQRTLVKESKIVQNFPSMKNAEFDIAESFSYYYS